MPIPSYRLPLHEHRAQLERDGLAGRDRELAARRLAYLHAAYWTPRILAGGYFITDPAQDDVRRGINRDALSELGIAAPDYQDAEAMGPGIRHAISATQDAYTSRVTERWGKKVPNATQEELDDLWLQTLREYHLDLPEDQN